MLITRRSLIAGATAGALTFSGRGQAATNVSLTGWAFAPDEVQINLDAFRAENPEFAVTPQLFAPADYGTRVVALGVAQQIKDLLYVRSENLEAWARAGYLQQVEGLSVVEAVKDDLFPFVRDGMSVNGKLFGLPYFTDYQAFYSNRELMEAAGIKAPPKTLDELKEQCLALKSDTLRYPLIFGFKKATWSNLDWWTQIFASGGRLFNDELDPVFDGEDETALNVLEWMVSAIHDWQIADPACVELDVNQTRDLLGGGNYAFGMAHAYDERQFNRAEVSAAAGKLAISAIPGLNGEGQSTFGLVRMYGLAPQLSSEAGCEALLGYLGGKDKSGQYATALRWYDSFSLGYGYKSLNENAELQKAFNQFGNGAAKSKLAASAKVSELQTAPWSAEWESFNYNQIQSALTKQLSAKEALAASATRARDLKSRSR